MGRAGEDEPVSANKIPFVAWNSLWLVGGSFALVLIVKDLIWTPLNTHIGRDFTNLWTAGKLVLDGRAWWAFDLDLFRLALIEFVRMPSLQNYSYPPHALFLDAPFALLPYYAALALWSVLGIAFFAWAAKPDLPKGFPAILAALTPAGCINLWAGHYGLLLGGLWLLFFRWYEKQPTRAGAVAAMLTIKPHLGLAIAFTALGKRKVLLSAVIGTLVLILLSALAFGPQTWSAFLFNTTSAQASILTRAGDDSYFRMMPSAYVTWHRGPVAVAFQIVVIVAVGVLLWRYRHWDAFIAATVTFLVIPYVFNYDLTVVCLGAIILMFKHWDELLLPQKVVLGAAFLSPNLTFVWPIAWATPLALLGLLLIQLRFSESRNISPHI